MMPVVAMGFHRRRRWEWLYQQHGRVYEEETPEPYKNRKKNLYVYHGLVPAGSVQRPPHRTAHDAQACIEMRVLSDALSAECPSGNSALSAECPQVLKKFCALSTECSGQFSSVLVGALISMLVSFQII